MDTRNRYRLAIARKVRRLRTERRWTQKELASLLGLSQPRLSQIEQGQGSFTAEQLFILLKNFNVPLNYFIQAKGEGEARLRNALARLGAAHLQESADVLPTERLEEALDVLRETVASATSPRVITAIAPVLIAQAGRLNLGKLAAELEKVGFAHRLGWAVENTVEAARKDLDRRPPRSGEDAFLQAVLILEDFLSRYPIKAPKPEDILDADILSEETLKKARAKRSAISRKWGIVSELRPEHFAEAVRAARE